MNIKELIKQAHENAVELSEYKGYFIDNQGNVYSRYRSGNKTSNKPIYDLKKMTPGLNKDGYLYININKNKKPHRVSIHRLLALTFIPNTKNKTDVNHIDGNKLNNSLSNLEWMTRKENIQHAFGIGLSNTKGHVAGEKNGRCKLTEIKVKEIIEKLKSGKSGLSIAKEYGVSKSTIFAIKNKKAWRCLYGY